MPALLAFFVCRQSISCSFLLLQLSLRSWKPLDICLHLCHERAPTLSERQTYASVYADFFIFWPASQVDVVSFLTVEAPIFGRAVLWVKRDSNQPFTSDWRHRRCRPIMMKEGPSFFSMMLSKVRLETPSIKVS